MDAISLYFHYFDFANTIFRLFYGSSRVNKMLPDFTHAISHFTFGR